MENKKIITSLYDYYKNSPKKLKIICDWDEVIQACEPYALWKSLGEKEKAGEFSEYFKEFWRLEDRIIYSAYGSKLADPFQDGVKPSYIVEKQQEIKNSPDFYQLAPFLTIAEDLLKLIKKDKVEEIIFLSAYDKRKFPNRDERKLDVFEQTFGNLGGGNDGEGEKGSVYYCHGNYRVCLRFELIPFDSETQGQTKADWIKENASDFDIFIDDNPNICKDIKLVADNLLLDDLKRDRMRVCSPYYPAVESQHNKWVLLIKNEVSGLKKEDFGK